jgi:hypothetical protein
MATNRFPNNTGQTGIYKTGTPNYVDVTDTYVVQDRFVRFSAKATDDGWADDDIIGIRIEKDASNYKVWKAKWDATYATKTDKPALLVVTEEDSVGTISDSDSVLITAVPTKATFDDVLFRPQFVVVSGTTHTFLEADAGKVHRFTSADAVTVTIDAALTVGWHAHCVQEGAGLVSFDPQSTDTLNGATDNVSMGGQFKSAYIYQHTEGAWIACV